MSEVISFRLDSQNPKEWQAFQVIKSKKSEGLSVRQIITDALISLGANHQDLSAKLDLNELQKVLSQWCKLLEKIDDQDLHLEPLDMGNSISIGLTTPFITAVKRGVRSGMREE